MSINTEAEPLLLEAYAGLKQHDTNESRTRTIEALERLERARQLSVHDRLMFKIHAATAYAHFFRGRYDEALQWAANALRARPSYLTAMRAAGASHMMAGRTEQARQCVEEVRRLDPALRMSNLAELLPLRRTQDFTRWADALHTAGLPD